MVSRHVYDGSRGRRREHSLEAAQRTVELRLAVFVAAVHEIPEEEHGIRFHCTHQRPRPRQVRVAQELHHLRRAATGNGPSRKGMPSSCYVSCTNDNSQMFGLYWVAGAADL